jgi:hypothetical protein
MVVPVRCSYCRATVIEPENTSTVLELYTRFLKCFVSAEKACNIAIVHALIGSMESTPTSQNAGCTMAIHADCTKAKKRLKINLLIYNGF